ncbi:MAG: FAD-dependent oxidoreductase [Candidatus Gracilibacteria bacterium]|nr:FAD-dependent oxidoreductase [Candidatus Gracilibacteria bacterium]
MQQTPFKLIQKNKLTHDVYELIFTIHESIQTEPGQYVLFLLPKSKLRRAYSIGYADGQTFTFIIKQIEGGAGSTEICSLEVGEELIGMVPLGHFVLKANTTPKLFVGTGTGFAPLYFQIRAMMDSGIQTSLLFLFGVRTASDMFYIDELNRIKKEYPMFEYRIFLSQEDSENTVRGRVTDFLTKENIAPYGEVYLCGSPAMVKDAREKLEANGIEKEKVFFEQY